jgi:hypothetical protein
MVCAYSGQRCWGVGSLVKLLLTDLTVLVVYMIEGSYYSLEEKSSFKNLPPDWDF